jgi:DNA topoisomerase I
VAGNGKQKRLVIVESPAKARTIKGYLGDDFVVESSVGHIRDLPERAADIPEEYKKEKWARLGVDVADGFRPLYIIDPDKKKRVAELKKLLKNADELLLATDEDREGEAIAWHLLEVLKPTVPVRRMVFHEITKDAIGRALGETRDIDERLVDAQETRRILDRLYGYEVSPVLWKKITRGLSAGRVQSVATRLVVERELERMAFNAAAWWDIEATFAALETPAAEPPASGGRTGSPEATRGESFQARLVSVDGKRLALGRDFGNDGKLKTEDALQLDEEGARGLSQRLEQSSFSVTRVEQKPYSRKPSPPFMTSTLQQEASRKLRYSAQTTMRIAQRLYENGYITYMRTDSTTLSESALNAARNQARELYGADYVPEQPRRYERKVKNAQEAHEAIRPAGDVFRMPKAVASELNRDENALYELIWMRTIASQMKDAAGQTVSLRIGATSSASERAEFGASGTVITFRGFLAAYEEGRDTDDSDDEERRLPNVSEGDALDLKKLEPQGHETNPPARYTEATLVRTLEELGIGRPSTYASILGTILDRGYVFKKGTALVPSFLAFSVVNLLKEHFTRLVDYGFTASMEDDLDRIASGDQDRLAWLNGFYFGVNDHKGLHELVSDLGAIDAREINSIELGNGIVLRVGRYGPYLERDGQRANVPEDIVPDELTVEKAEELLAQPSGDRELGNDPETGREVVARTGRYGPYVTEVLEEGSKEKPRTASLFKSMAPDTVTLEEALQLLSLPRVVGESEGEEVTARNGRYGPYVQKGKESRSLETEEQLFSISLDDALAVLAQPRQRRGGRQAATPLKEVGADPVSGKPIVVKSGRFGPYVTDGETNASLRSGDDPEGITLDRAIELLADRRARGPATKKKKATSRKRAS